MFCNALLPPEWAKDRELWADRDGGTGGDLNSREFKKSLEVG